MLAHSCTILSIDSIFPFTSLSLKSFSIATRRSSNEPEISYSSSYFPQTLSIFAGESPALSALPDTSPPKDFVTSFYCRTCITGFIASCPLTHALWCLYFCEALCFAIETVIFSVVWFAAVQVFLLFCLSLC